MQGEADAVIGYPVLRVVVGADFSERSPGLDLSPPLPRPGRIAAFPFLFVEAGAEYAHGFGAIFDLGFFILLETTRPLGMWVIRTAE